MNIMVFDTETTNLEKPFCYNIGYVIYNTDTGERLLQKDFVVEQVWHNTMLFTTAYYADKRPIYVNRMKGRTCRMEKFGYITQTMYRDIQEYEVQYAFAYNSPFDTKVFEFNCDWFKCINPLDTVTVIDIRGHVHHSIAFTEEYQAFCDTHGLYTDNGNYSTTAEALTRFLQNNAEFIEEHTALADALIELEILKECVARECNWETEYQVYRSIPKIVMKEYEVIDAEGNTHKFPYTTKRNLNEGRGIRLTIKREAVT